MDVVTLGMAKADARKLPRTSHLSVITGRLKRGIEDVVLAVLGDSTGNENDEWVYLTGQYLAGKYPAYKVLHRLWNDTNQNYDAAVTIGNGAAARTLTIYNASTPGKLASYSTPILAAQLPVTPHAVIISYAHNSSATTARPDNYVLTRAVREMYPFAPIVLTAQNPRIATDADYANGLLRQQSVIDLAQSEGHGLINVLQTFLANPTYATDWLMADGLHPNTAGRQVWANEVARHLEITATAITPVDSRTELSKIWIPANHFILKSGTPTQTASAESGPQWSFPATGTAVIVGSIDLPSNWDQVKFYGLWGQTTFTGFTSANNVARMRLRYKGLGSPGYATAPSTAAATAALGGTDVTFAANNGGALDVKKTSILATVAFRQYGYGTPVVLEVARMGDDALDTYADPMLLLGVMAVRAS